MLACNLHVFAVCARVVLSFARYIKLQRAQAKAKARREGRQAEEEGLEKITVRSMNDLLQPAAGTYSRPKNATSISFWRAIKKSLFRAEQRGHPTDGTNPQVGSVAPAHFFDGVFGTMLKDPVMLPSSRVVTERSAAEAHIARCAASCVFVRSKWRAKGGRKWILQGSCHLSTSTAVQYNTVTQRNDALDQHVFIFFSLRRAFRALWPHYRYKKDLMDGSRLNSSKSLIDMPDLKAEIAAWRDKAAVSERALTTALFLTLG